MAVTATAEERLLRYPRFAMSADGRIIAPGPQIAIFPGPALPNLQATRVSAAGVAKVAQAAIDAGLTGPNRDLVAGDVGDAPVTSFRLDWNGTSHVTRVANLDAGMGGNAERDALSAFLIQLQDIRTALPGDVADTDQPHEPTEMRLVVRAENPAAASDPQFVRVLDWPLAAELGSAGEALPDGGARCAVVEGDDLRTVLRAAGQANQLTYWRSGSETYRVDFRPLYPHETGCPAA